MLGEKPTLFGASSTGPRRPRVGLLRGFLTSPGLGATMLPLFAGSSLAFVSGALLMWWFQAPRHVETNAPTDAQFPRSRGDKRQAARMANRSIRVFVQL